MVAPKPVDDVALLAQLVAHPTQEQQLTYTRHTDGRTALARGLAQYLAPVEMDWLGRKLGFKKVHQVWSEPTSVGEYPALAIVGAVDALYDTSTFSPILTEISDGTKRYLRSPSEIQQDFAVIVWAADITERMGLVAALEDALEPVNWMSGVRLMLPFYFGAHATYEKKLVLYDDSVSNANRNWRKAVIAVTANVPQYVPAGNKPTMIPQTRVILTEEGDL